MSAISQFTFGAEFEVILPPRYTHASAGIELSRIAGLTVRPSRRGEAVSRTSQDFRIVNDGSVRGAGVAAEFVSPILKGQEGLDKITRFAQALAQIGATVNQSCGYHVHVGGFRPELPFFKNLVKIYAKFELAIDTVMPASRRGPGPTYCKTVRRVNAAQLEAATSVNAIIRAVTGLADHDYGRRFYKLNLASFEKHSTVEFRQHAGTVDAAKATAWIKTCLRMVAAAQAGKSGDTAVASLDISSIDLSALAPKTRAVLEAITRPSGATRREILDAHPEFGTVSVHRHARLAGINYTTTEQRRPGRATVERFFAVAGTAPAEIPATLPGLFAVIEAPADETAFFEARAQALAV